jgi:predicted DNA-binding protein
MATTTKKEKREKAPTPYTAGGQVLKDELEALNEIAKKTGRSRSDVVRRAIKRLIVDDAKKRIDWSISTDAEE